MSTLKAKYSYFKKEYLAFCAEEGIEQDKFWEKIKPLCHTSEKADACSGSYKYSYVGFNPQNKLLAKCSKCPWYKDNRERDGAGQ